MKNIHSQSFQLSSDDVINAKPGVMSSNLSSTFKLEKLFDFLSTCMFRRPIYPSVLNTTGFGCEVLQLGQTRWQKGTLKVSITFIPDEIPDELPDEPQAPNTNQEISANSQNIWESSLNELRH